MNKKQIIRELRLYKLNSIFPVPFSEEKVLFKRKKPFNQYRKITLQGLLSIQSFYDLLYIKNTDVLQKIFDSFKYYSIMVYNNYTYIDIIDTQS